MFLKQALALGLLPVSVKLNALDKYTGAYTELVTEQKLVSSYNNYYEFSTNKRMVKHIAKDFDTSGWTLAINGLVKTPVVLTLEEFHQMAQVSRTCKLRCVEGWSAVIPWQGIEFNQLLNIVSPTSQAKYVKFTSLLDPSRMIGQRTAILPWPYQEGLRLDEALHPLTMIASGMYGKPLPNQNGAPLRLVVPWKYGYKSIKAITEITFTDEQPISSWQIETPSEYGFYGNVNPSVPHPRWSQRRELPLGQLKKIKTQMLNGYAQQVASLYQDEDLNALF